MAAEGEDFDHPPFLQHTSCPGMNKKADIFSQLKLALLTLGIKDIIIIIDIVHI